MILYVHYNRNIQAFNTALMGTTPLFQIEAILATPQIALHPNSSEVYKLIIQCVGDCVEITKVHKDYIWIASGLL